MYLLIISPCHICKHIQQHPLELWMFIFHHSSIDSRRFVPTQAPCPFETFSQFCLKLWIYLFLFVFSLVILCWEKTHDWNFLSVNLPIRLEYDIKTRFSTNFLVLHFDRFNEFWEMFRYIFICDTNRDEQLEA